MKYVSLDIETTGLDKNKNQIVEVGAVLDEIGSTTPIEELPKFRAVLLHDEMVMGAYCANLHRDLWAEILEAQDRYRHPIEKYGFVTGMLSGREHTYYCKPEEFEGLFYSWVSKNYMRPFPSDNMSDIPEVIKINIAGKNPGTFDIPFLEALPGWQGLVKFQRRVLDPASHFIRLDDEHIPDLQECLKRCGFEGTVSHTAVDDAIDIIRVIRQQRIGKHINKSVCASCTDSYCSGRDDTLFNCSGHIKYTAETSSCDKCDAYAACGYRDGRDSDKPCGHFNPKN